LGYVYTGIGKSTWPIIVMVISKMKDSLRSQVVAYSVEVVISRKQCKAETVLLQTPNRKWYMAHRLAPFSRTFEIIHITAIVFSNAILRSLQFSSSWQEINLDRSWSFSGSLLMYTNGWLSLVGTSLGLGTLITFSSNFGRSRIVTFYYVGHFFIELQPICRQWIFVCCSWVTSRWAEQLSFHWSTLARILSR